MFNIMSTTILVLCFIVCFVYGDIYFHNPRGSNNRLNEAQFNRKNANRLFNSQNNNRGGYNVGSVYYHHGTELELEWTNQHSCGGPNNNCQIVIQYMCGPHIRDGVTVKTIPVTAKADMDSEYGQHENLDHYLRCSTRRRNERLFTADQKLKKNSASYTRQNPGGTRYGYECSEERDYYPYWHGSPWKDMAVLTNDVSRCDYYQSESQNVKAQWECLFKTDELNKIHQKRIILPNNEVACQTARPLGFRGVWTKISSHKLPAPECREVQFTRDNHLGHTVGLKTPRYAATIPTVDSHNCVFRIRYNISTNDYDSWAIDSNSNADTPNGPTKVDLAYKYKLTTQEAIKRGYVFENAPKVQIFPGADFKLELAINTAQYGRTFQDRSHSTGFRPRPESLTGTKIGTKIHNVNVRGKRGNIVQVYPAVEYDFVPNTLEMSVGDYVHFQWTGSDQNPAEAAGNGRAKTDRSNVVRLTPTNYPEAHKIESGYDDKYGHYGNNYPQHLNTSNYLGFGREELENLAFLSNVQYGGLMSQLDDASPYFNLPPRKVTKAGTFYYMSTRNNDFTNRDQKAVVHAFPFIVLTRTLGFRGGNVFISDRVSMQVDEGVLCGLQEFSFREWSRDEGEQTAKKHGQEVAGKEYASDFIVIYPLNKYCLHADRYINLEMATDADAGDVSVYHTNPESFAAWTKIDSRSKSGKVSFQIDQGGAYVVRVNHNRNIGLIVGVIFMVVIMGLVIGSLVYFRKHPNKFTEMTYCVRNCKRGTQAKI